MFSDTVTNISVVTLLALGYACYRYYYWDDGLAKHVNAPEFPTTNCEIEPLKEIPEFLNPLPDPSNIEKITELFSSVPDFFICFSLAYAIYYISTHWAYYRFFFPLVLAVGKLLFYGFLYLVL